jgi:hypothetical protein
MTYQGQSDQKRIARVRFWNFATWFVRDRRDEVSVMQGQRCLVLLGPDAGDIETANTFGFLQQHIIGVDTNADYCRRAKTRFPLCDIREGDVVAVGVEPVSVVFLDLCNNLTRELANTIWRVADRALADGGVLGVGFMRGRERRAYRAKAVAVGIPVENRAEVLAKWLNERSLTYRRSYELIPVTELRYQGTGVPMSYVSFVKTTRRCDRYTQRYSCEVRKLSDVSIRKEALRLADIVGSDKAGRLLSVPRPRISAWLAHRKMGSYDETR